jgi:S-DNA-T family DNA segregation ATPase FtsK/SpoIIIE
MEIKELINKCVNFSIKKFKELLGLSLSMMGLLLLIALISYSPEDPNFIFPQNMHIQNILGFKGSFTADLFYQSLGFISILVPFTIFFTGINIIRFKKNIFLIESLFFTILYSLLGSLFFSIFYKESFWLSISGNGGFIGKYLEKTFLNSLVVSIIISFKL